MISTQITIDVTKLEVADLLGAYNGLDHRCACGCSGRHSYVAANRAAAEKNRGYAISDDEVSDRSVAYTLRKVQTNPTLVERNSDNCYSVSLGTRIYIVYVKGRGTVTWTV